MGLLLIFLSQMFLSVFLICVHLCSSVVLFSLRFSAALCAFALIPLPFRVDMNRERRKLSKYDGLQ
jgi:hypothetical protein